LELPRLGRPRERCGHVSGDRGGGGGFVRRT
jgi:hypothetical protein